MSQKVKLTILNELSDIKHKNIFFKFPYDEYDFNSGKMDNLEFKIFSYYVDNLIYNIQIWQLCTPLNYPKIIDNHFSDTDMYIVILDLKSSSIDNFMTNYNIIFNKKIFLIIIGTIKDYETFIRQISKNNIDIIKSFHIENIKKDIVKKTVKDIIQKSVQIIQEDLHDIDLDSDDEKTFLVSDNTIKVKNYIYKWYKKYKCF